VVTTDASYIGREIRKLREDLNEHGATQRATGRLEAIAEVVEEIQSATSRMEKIVADLRTQSRPLESTADVADLRRCVEWALRVTSQESRDRARVFTNLSDTPLARGDEARIGQVLINLLKNAAQSIEPGNVARNAITLATHVDAEGRPVIEVSDTGSGIPPHMRERIFEPFITTKPVGIGTGLGLPVCQGIVNSIGGRIELESEVGKGTTFRLILMPASGYLPAQ
jgi:two-component system NtrC family sensor kinase